MERDEFAVTLREKGIDTRPFFFPMHTQPPYRNMNQETLPVAEDLALRGISLPSATTLKRKQIEYICETIIEVMS
jgi:perosamine synthetase